MHRHGPDCLDGPLSRSAPWWVSAAPAPASPSASAAADRTTLPPKNPSFQDQPFRAELVERVRREIAEGRYETQEKLQAALERLLDELARG
jgi:negative regulator of flagellin synthesis FlgM